MNKKNNRLIWGLIYLNTILIIWICFHNNFEFEKILNSAKELALFEFATISIYIAISLFDQFGLNKKITEKRVELIIELLTEFKKQSGIGSHYIINGKLKTNPAFYYEKDMLKKESERYLEYPDLGMDNLLNTPIIMSLEDFDNAFMKVRKVLNNPIMPKIIVDKAQFIGSGGGGPSKKYNDYPDRLYLYFTREGKMKLVKKETKYWTFSVKNDCTLQEFLQKFDTLFETCKKWTDDHSNIDLELNLKNFD